MIDIEEKEWNHLCGREEKFFRNIIRVLNSTRSLNKDKVEFIEREIYRYFRPFEEIKQREMK